jgi:general secretion pathway protein G
LIDEYSYDKKRRPQSLDDLVGASYIKGIPSDPFTGKPDWRVTQEETMSVLDQTEPGINDVHSSSDLIGSDGRPYSQW